MTDTIITEGEQTPENRQDQPSLLCSAEEVAAMLGIGRTLFYGLISSGKIGPVPIKLGTRVLWRRTELEEWVAAGCPTRERWVQRKSLQQTGPQNRRR